MFKLLAFTHGPEILELLVKDGKYPVSYELLSFLILPKTQL